MRFFFSTGSTLVQHPQTVGQTDFIVHFTVRQEVTVVLVELVSILVADAVDDHVVVQMSGVNVGGDHHLESGNCFCANSRPMALTSWGVILSSAEKDWTK